MSRKPGPVQLPPENIHRITGEADPKEAAATYEKRLRGLLGTVGGNAIPGAGLDLVLLGMGPDGHTASLFPGKAGVHERVRWVAADFIEVVGMWRVTLTPVVINKARHVSFIVSGTTKAERLNEVLEGPYTLDRLPAQAVRPTRGHLTWLIDEAAATRLHAR